MAISLRATTTVVTATGTPASITLNLPAGAVATDILIASICVLGGTGATITPVSAGWTLSNRTNSTTVVGTAIYWALGNVSSMVFNLSGVSKVVAGCTGYVGVDNTTPMDVTAAGQANASSTTWTSPSVTTVTNQAWAVCAFGGASASTFTIGPGLTDRGNGVTGAGGTKNALDEGDSNAGLAIGATGTFTTLASLTAVSCGVTAALRPAAVAFVPLLNVTVLQAVSRLAVM